MTTDLRKTALAVGAFALVLGARCGDYERGIEVQVDLRPQAPVQSIVTDLSYRVSLEMITVRVASVRLVPCPNYARRWQNLLNSTAYAHHVDVSPDQGEGHAALHLLEANGTPLPITTLRPPPGKYCHAELTLGPIQTQSEPGMQIKGQAERDGRTRTFDWQINQSPPMTFVIAPALEVSADMLDAQLIFDLDQALLFDGHDFMAHPETHDLSARMRAALVLSTPETTR